MTLDKMSPDKVVLDKMSGMYEMNEYTVAVLTLLNAVI